MITVMSALLLTCCATAKAAKTVVPDIVFPRFPSLDGAHPINATETAVPNSWLFKLAEYKILIEETEKNYSELKKLYTEENK